MTEQTTAPVDSGATPATLSAEERVANLLFGAEKPEEPKQEAAEQAPDQEAPDQPTEDAAPKEDAAPEEESEEVEFEGTRYLVPKPLKEALLRQKDYTQKTQEAANLRRLAEQERQAIQLDAEFGRRTEPLRVKLQAIESQLEEAKSINWSELDTDKLVRVRYALDQLKDQKSTLEQQIGAERTKFGQEFQQHVASTIAEGQKVLKQWIPSFDDNLAKSIAQYGIGEGYSEQEMATVLDPRMVRTLWKAKQFDELQKSTPLALAKATKAPPVIKPGNSTNSAPKTDTLKKIIKTSKDRHVKENAALKWLESKM